MNIKAIVDQIIQIPEKLYSQWDTSIYALLKETGYFDAHDQIDESVILDAINRNPTCIKNWLLLCENKRTASGWYFIKAENKYIVGYYPPEIDSNKLEYSDVAEACSAFIKKEIEDIRKN